MMKKVVLREDLMELTKDIVQSMVLGQMIYWTKTMDAVNELVFEENKRLAEENLPQHEYNYGWIWKSARDMKSDLLNAFGEDSISRAFAALVKLGVLLKRNNPKFRYDRTLQYRVDLVLLRRKLKELGYEMTDFALKSIPQEAESIPLIAESIPQIAEAIPKITTEGTYIELPLTPSKGESESSAMASHSNSTPTPTLYKKRRKRLDERPPDDEFIAKMKQIHGNIDVDRQLQKMDSWLVTHPDCTKSRRFISGWLNRCTEFKKGYNADGTINWDEVKPNE